MTTTQAPEGTPSTARILFVAAATTLAVAVAARVLPDSASATAIGLGFLGVTYFLVLRDPSGEHAAHHGLSFGGLLESRPLEPRRILRETAVALAWALGIALIVFPPFAIGFTLYWHPARAFQFAPIAPVVDEALGQLLVVALPEEAFYRGYLQTSLDDRFPKRWKLLGGWISPGILVSSAIFALGHLLTEPNPSRLAVFFPSLLFGWLRTRTRGAGAGTFFHALCNLFSAYLGRCFAMWT